MKLIVIGAGVAGLAAAIRSAKQGFEVEIFENQAVPGGKLTFFERKGYRFDAGPSLLTMPSLIDELITLCNKEPSSYFNYKSLETACHYFFESGKRFEASTDVDSFVKNIKQKFNIEEAALKKYLDHISGLYHSAGKLFLENSLHKASTYLSLDTLKAIVKFSHPDMLRSMHEANKKWLKDPDLIQLFDRFATYNGSNPYKAPGILTMIPVLEHELGTYIAEGGMHAITETLYKLALELGVVFHFNTSVDRIIHNNNEVIGVEAKGEKHLADIVISNMDVYPTYRKLMPDTKAPEKTLSQERSSSALIFYWGIKGSFKELDLHNIFFSGDYKEEFDTLFSKQNITNDPTVYINITSKHLPEDAPEGCENWFVMINAPYVNGQDWDEITVRTRKNVLNKLSKMLGRAIEPLIETEDILDPIGIEQKTSSYKGALYGTSSNDRLAAFLRHPNFSSKIKGLYFCGGSVHPGGGVPLCLLSARITSEIIAKDYAVHSK